MKRVVDPFVLFVIGAVATIALAMNSLFTVAEPGRTEMIAALGAAAIPAVCAAVVLIVALRFGRKEPWRRQWLLVGLGVAAYALSRTAGALDLATAGAGPWAWSSEVLLLAEYLLLGAALVAVAQAYVPMVDWRRPAVGAAVFGAVALGVLWFGVISPYVMPTVETTAEALRSALYPALDILILLVPAVFVALCLAQVGGRRFAAPWYALAAGAALLALGDAGVIVLQATGRYWPGSLIDYAPIAAQVLVAMGALAAAELGAEFMGAPGPLAQDEE